MDPSRKPTIEYPCIWEYKIIGKDADRMRQAVAAVFGSRAYTIKPSHESATGKYVSLAVETVEETDESRINTFESLRNHADIRMVL